MKPVAYVAGPMRGRPFFNFPTFDAAAEKLRADGFAVYNPADHDREVLGLNERLFPNGSFRDAGWEPPMIVAFLRRSLAWDTARICESTHLALLPGWEQSEGVTRVELPLAMLLGLHRIYLT